MGQLNKHTLYAIRANDIFPAISRIISPITTTDLKLTKDYGALANLSKLVKNVTSVISKDNLTFLAANIGIDEYACDHYVRILEEIGFVNIAGKKVENLVPTYSLDIFDTLGKHLENSNISEVELQHFQLLNSIAELPSRVVDIRHSLDISSKNLDNFKKFGQNCGYLQSYVSPKDGKEILFSPVYWEENPEKLFSLVEKFDYDNVLNSISTIRTNQGKPISSIQKNPILAEAISIGCLPTNSVTSAAGEKYFAFTPNLGVKKYEKDIIKKARQIVACVRYGESFGQITKIHKVTDVINSLIRGKGYIGDHSENIYQYGILIEMGVVFPKKAYYGYEIHLNDTPENRKIFDIALELLQTGTIVDNDTMVDANNMKTIFSDKTRMFGDELNVLNKFKQQVPNNTSTLQKIGDILRGVDEDVFK